MGNHTPTRDTNEKTPLLRRLLSIDALCAGLVAAITLFVFAGVIFRYVLQMPLTWGEEFTRYAFTWLAFLSAALAMKYHGHSAIDMLADMLPARAKRVQRLTIELIVAAFLVVFTYYSYEMMLIAHGQRSSALQVPLSWVYAAAPVSSLLMLGYALRNAAATLERSPSP